MKKLLPTKRLILAQSYQQSEKIDRIEVHFQPAVDIFKIHRDLTDEELKILAPVLAGVEFFQKSCPSNVDIEEFIEHCLKHVNYCVVPKGEAVFHHGDRGEMFYIILKGIAGVYVPRDEDEIEKEDMLTLLALNKMKQSEKLEKPLNNKKEKDTNFRNIMQRAGGKFASIVEGLVALKKGHSNRYFTERGTLRYIQVEQLFAGQYFGEVALVNDSPRGASILAMSNLSLLTLTKISYTLVFEQQMQNDTQKHNSIQQAFSHTGMNKIPPVFTALFRGVSFNSKDILWREDDVADQFLILVNGALTYQKKDRTIKNKQIKLCTLSSDAILGHNELLLNIPKRLYTCISETICFAYHLPYEQFKNAMKQHPQLAAQLQKDSISFTEWAEDRLNFISIQQQSKSIQNQDPPYYEGRGLEEEFFALAEIKGFRTRKNKIITVRSLNQSQPSQMQQVNSNTIKLSRLQSQNDISQGLNLMHLYQGHRRTVSISEKTNTKSLQRSYISPQIKESLKHHLKEIVKDQQRGIQFRGLIKSMNQMHVFREKQPLYQSPQKITNYTVFP